MPLDNAAKNLLVDRYLQKKILHHAIQKRFQNQVKQSEIKPTQENQFLERLSTPTLERLIDTHPLANERIKRLDLSFHQGDIRAPLHTQYKGHFYVNNHRFELHLHTHGELEGTILSYPRYDTKALTSMYNSDYFGRQATLQVGIPDRGQQEIQRRKAIATLQVNEWESVGISIKNTRIVEVGGGSGYLSQEIKRRSGNPINVELCQERVDHCRSQNIEAYHGMLRDALADHTIPPSSVDIVACYDLLEHIVDPEVFIKDITRALKANGKLALRIPETPPNGPTLHLVDHVNHFSRQSLIHFMRQNGLSLVPRPKNSDNQDPYYSGTFSESLNVPPTSKLQPRTIENITVFFQKDLALSASQNHVNDHIQSQSQPTPPTQPLSSTSVFVTHHGSAK